MGIYYSRPAGRARECLRGGARGRVRLGAGGDLVRAGTRCAAGVGVCDPGRRDACGVPPCLRGEVYYLGNTHSWASYGIAERYQWLSLWLENKIIIYQGLGPDLHFPC